jgi:prepilin-type N-terminal cleavage/methylation domain-containing protein
MHQATRIQSAFSLVELSIVLVILGLLTGGILAGQSLIKASELRTIANEMNDVNRALFAFKDKYFALPGDMTNATAFWGSASCSAGGVGTCNGNGDGSLYAYNDAIHAWEQLGLAGLLPYQTDGRNNVIITGQTLPVSRVRGGTMEFYATTSPGMWQSTGNLLFYNVANTGGGPLAAGVLTAEEAWNIDTKMDDGVPNTGKWITRQPGGTPYCTTPSNSDVVPGSAPVYQLNDTSYSGCQIAMRLY